MAWNMWEVTVVLVLELVGAITGTALGLGIAGVIKANQANNYEGSAYAQCTRNGSTNATVAAAGVVPFLSFSSNVDRYVSEYQYLNVTNGFTIQVTGTYLVHWDVIFSIPPSEIGNNSAIEFQVVVGAANVTGTALKWTRRGAVIYPVASAGTTINLSATTIVSLLSGDIVTLRNPSAISAEFGSIYLHNTQVATFNIVKLSDAYTAGD